MYTVYANDELIYDPAQQDEEHSILQPKLELKTNDAGSLSFILPPANNFYEQITKLTTIIKVYRDDDLIFRGRVFSDEMDFYKLKTFACEGDMTFFVDSIQRPFRYTSIPVGTVFRNLITSHNQLVDSYKQFQIGTISQTFMDKVSPVSSTNFASTSDCLSSLINEFGGIIRTRCEIQNGEEIFYVDWIDQYSSESDQIIEYGINLQDLTSKQSSEKIFTVLVPTGKDIQDSDGNVIGKVTIESVNQGKDYIQNDEMVSTFGRIEATVNWSDVENPSELLTLAQDYLTKNCLGLEETWTMRAVDLSEFVPNVDKINLGDKVRVFSEPHGLDQIFTCNQVTIDLGEPGNNEYTFGEESTSLSQRIIDTERKFKDEIISTTSSFLKDAKQEATNLINSAMGGYILKTNGELYIMDTPDINTATKVWRWNYQGLGWWSGQPGGATDPHAIYDSAITIDGSIVANKITSGEMNAERMRAYSGQDVNVFSELTYDGIRMYEIQNGVKVLTSSFRKPDFIFKDHTDGVTQTQKDGQMAFSNWNQYSIFFITLCAGMWDQEGPDYHPYGRSLTTTFVFKEQMEDMMKGASRLADWYIRGGTAKVDNYVVNVVFDNQYNVLKWRLNSGNPGDVTGVIVYGM